MIKEQSKKNIKNIEREEKNSIPRIELVKRLAYYHKPYKHLLFIAFILTIISNTCLLLGPYLTGNAIDAIGLIENGVGFEQVYKICFLMAICYILSAVLTYIISRIMIHIGKNIASNLRDDIQEHLLKLPISYFDTKQAGDIISCFSYDISTLNTSLTNDLLVVANSVFTIIASFIMMINISAKLVLVFSITISMTVFLAIYRLKKTKPLFRKRSKKLASLNGYTEEILSGIKTIIAYQQQEEMKKRYKKYNEEGGEAYYHADFQGTKMGAYMGLISNISLSLIGLFGTLFYMSMQITIGNLSSFVLYSRKFTGPINELANLAGEIQSAFSASNRIFSLLDEEIEPVDIKNAKVLENVQGDVSIKNVNFGYVPDKIVLQNMCIEAKSGQTIAIVGPTGSGKSTIINLLMRFYDYQSGSIKIDGIPINEVTRNSLRKCFTMVLQDTWIFQGTIFDNIAYIHEDATIQDVKKVAKDSKIDTFINTLPKGYNTIITDEGSNLSKGQKQLIAIARAMLVKAPMLILDEATSNIDSATELLVQEAMSNLMQNKTCFVIAHRLSTIKNADKIVVIGNGAIMEQGTHEELLNKDGYYKTMFYSQFV